MAWSTPRTWVTAEKVTSAYFNTMSDQFTSFGDHETWQTDWTPSINAITIDPTYGGGATRTGRYIQNGNICVALWKIIFAAGMTAGTGRYRLEVDTPPNMAADVTGGALVGGGYIKDDSGGDVYMVNFHREFAQQAGMHWDNHGGGHGEVTHNSPFAWAADDEMYGWLEYQTT